MNQKNQADICKNIKIKPPINKLKRFITTLTLNDFFKEINFLFKKYMKYVSKNITNNSDTGNVIDKADTPIESTISQTIEREMILAITIVPRILLYSLNFLRNTYPISNSNINVMIKA